MREREKKERRERDGSSPRKTHNKPNMTVCLFYESVVFVDNLIVKVTLTEVACVCKFEQEQHHFCSYKSDL